MERLSVLVLCLTTIGCSLTATMVPVEGPLSERRPLPVLEVKVEGISVIALRSLAVARAGGAVCASAETTKARLTPS